MRAHHLIIKLHMEIITQDNSGGALSTTRSLVGYMRKFRTAGIANGAANGWPAKSTGIANGAANGWPAQSTLSGAACG